MAIHCIRLFRLWATSFLTAVSVHLIANLARMFVSQAGLLFNPQSVSKGRKRHLKTHVAKKSSQPALVWRALKWERHPGRKGVRTHGPGPRAAAGWKHLLAGASLNSPHFPESRCQGLSHQSHLEREGGKGMEGQGGQQHSASEHSTGVSVSVFFFFFLWASNVSLEWVDSPTSISFLSNTHTRRDSLQHPHPAPLTATISVVIMW